MPWEDIQLNNGNKIPGIACGTWHSGNGQQATDQVEQAIGVGFNYIDTAQAYGNEKEAGQALRESGVPRTDLFITTKFSGMKDVETSIQDSLDNLGVSYVDLYLVHHPRLANGDIPGLWKKLENIYSKGLAKNIGVSNFGVADLALLLKDIKVKPAVNQILFHPYNQVGQLPIVQLCKNQGIIVEAYSPLTPITTQPGGSLDKPLKRISTRLSATTDQVLLAWNKSKGTAVVTSKKERLEGYLKAGDLELTSDDIRDIDVAGALGVVQTRKSLARRLALTASAAGVLWGASRVLGLGFF